MQIHDDDEERFQTNYEDLDFPSLQSSTKSRTKHVNLTRLPGKGPPVGRGRGRGRGRGVSMHGIAFGGLHPDQGGLKGGLEGKLARKIEEEREEETLARKTEAEQAMLLSSSSSDEEEQILIQPSAIQEERLYKKMLMEREREKKKRGRKVVGTQGDGNQEDTKIQEEKKIQVPKQQVILSTTLKGKNQRLKLERMTSKKRPKSRKKPEEKKRPLDWRVVAGLGAVFAVFLALYIQVQ